MEFLVDFPSELEAPWWRPGGFLELPWTFFSESGKRLGRDITSSAHSEEVRSRFRGRFLLILEVKTGAKLTKIWMRVEVKWQMPNVRKSLKNLRFL